jgi:uncharacterized protein (TIGR03083 family)
MIRTAAAVDTIPPIRHREAMQLAAVENDRFVDAVRALPPGTWTAQTDNDEWDVRSMVAHVLGAMEANASMRENLHQLRCARRFDGPLVDGLSAVQVAERSRLEPAELVSRLEAVAAKAVRGRRRVPGPVRNHARMEVELPGITETWTLGFLLDVIYTRDTWMHRVDLSRAAGQPMVLTPEHDGRIVADAVAEWARRHGQPFTLTLEGPAGGVYHRGGADAREYRVDAVEFCRIVSGRAEGDGLLSQPVAF